MAELITTPRCTHVILHCIDFRIQPVLQNWMLEKDMVGDVDIISTAGSCKNQAVALENLEIACRLHRPEHLWFLQHEDCGAYGGRLAFDSDVAQRQTLLGDMEALARRATKLRRGIRVHQLLVRAGKKGWWVEEVGTVTPSVSVDERADETP